MRERAAVVAMWCALAVAAGSAQTPARRPDRVLQAGHAGLVQALAFSPDGRWIASGGSDRIVILWNAATGDELRRLPAQPADVVQVAFTPDSRRIASLASNGSIRMWNVATGMQVAAASAGGRARHFSFSPDGSLWAVAVDAPREGATARIVIHNAADGAVARTLTATWADTDAMVMTTTGQLIASGSDGDEGTRTEWSVASGQVVSTRTSGAQAFSPDGTLLADVAFSPQAQIVIAEVATGRRRQAVAIRNPGAIAFAPDNRTVAVSDSSGTQLTLVSVESGQARTINGGMSDVGIMALAFSADGVQLAAAPYGGSSIKTWATATGRETHTLFGQNVVQGIAVSPSGQWMAVGSKENLALWDVAAGRRVAILWSGAVSDVTFSRDGRWLAANAGTRFPGESMKVWDMGTRTVAADFTIGTGGTPFQSIAFLDGTPSMTSLGPLSKAWSFAADGQQHALWSASSPASASPGGKLLAVGEGAAGDVGVWDVQAGRKLTTIRTQSAGVITLGFSPDGHSLMTAGQGGPPIGRDRDGHAVFRWTIRLWDTAAFAQQWEMSFDATSAPCAAFAPDSRQLAIQTSWERVDLVDVTSGMRIGAYAGRDAQAQNHQYSRGDLAFSPDGRVLYQGAQDGVRAWALPAR